MVNRLVQGWLCWFLLVSQVVQGADWRSRPIEDEVFYFILVDRFDNGDKSNDYGGMKASAQPEAVLKHGFEPTRKGYFHGGDLRGILRRLDYLQGMGVTALWLSPIFKNRPVQGLGTVEESSAGYHGYWVEDFTRIDPHLGRDEDFSALIAAAHKRSMKVFMDVITNHTADVIYYKECGTCPYRSVKEFPYTNHNQDFRETGDLNQLKSPEWAYQIVIPEKDRKIKKPDWLNNPLYYHNRGHSTFSGESSLMGDFFGLDDLMTEHPRVVRGMTDIYTAWIKSFAMDGFRVDTVKHVNIEFWQQFVPAIRAFAQNNAVPDFFIFGEVFTGDPKVLSYYTRAGKMDSVLDFGFHGLALDLLANGKGRKAMERVFGQDSRYGHEGAQRLMTFVSNHDVGRLGSYIEKNFGQRSEKEKLNRSLMAHALMFLARGVPVIYYGDEQGFTGDGGDKDAREDMMPSQVASYNDNNLLGTKKTTKDDNFDTTHPLYQEIRALSQLVKDHPVLRRGRFSLHQNPAGMQNGLEEIVAFSRFQPEGLEYLALFNTSTQSVETSLEHWASVPWVEKLDVGGGKGKGKGQPQRVQTRKKIVLEPLSWQLFQSSQPMAARLGEQTIAWVSPRAGALMNGDFYLEAKAAPGHGVDFYLKPEGSGDWQKIHTTYSQPWRAYLDAAEMKPGRYQAKAVLLGSAKTDAAAVTVSFSVSPEPPQITLLYANPHGHEKAFHIYGSGVSVLPQKLDQGRYRFQWQPGEQEALVIFQSREDQKPLGSRFDQPFSLNYKRDVLPLLKMENGQAVAQVKLPDQGRLLPFNMRQKPPFGDIDLFVRGGMNTWEAKTPMVYQGNFTYSTRVHLEPGWLQYKFADAQWSAERNFGAPVGTDGLNISGGSQNLSILIDEKQAGDYVFDLIYYPPEVMTSGRALAFYRISPVGKGPLLLKSPTGNQKSSL